MILAVLLVGMLISGIRYQTELDQALADARRATAEQYRLHRVRMIPRSPYDWSQE
jgi:hypothetical protein